MIEDFLVNLAAGLTQVLLQAASAGLRERVLGTPQERALRRAYDAGFRSLLNAASPGLSEGEVTTIAELFRKFLSRPNVADTLLGVALAGSTPDLGLLSTDFVQMWGDNSLRMGLQISFDQVMRAFHAALTQSLIDEGGRPGSPLFNQVNLGRVVAIQALLHEQQQSLSLIDARLTALESQSGQTAYSAISGRIGSLASSSPRSQPKATDSGLLKDILELISASEIRETNPLVKQQSRVSAERHGEEYREEYLRLLFVENETAGLGEWIKAFYVSLNRLDLTTCRRLLSMAKRQHLSASGRATVLFNDGLLLAEIHSWDDALQRLTSCLNIRKSSQNQLGSAEALVQIGRVHRSVGQFVKARGSLLEGLSLVQSSQEVSHTATTLREIGQILETQGQFEAAQAVYQQSIEAVSRGWGAAESHYHLGLLEQLRGNYAGSEENYRTAIREIDPTTARQRILLADVVSQLGFSLFERGDMLEAARQFERTLELSSEAGILSATQGRAMRGLGLIFHYHGDRIKALKCYEEAAGIFEDIKSEDDRVSVLLQLGMTDIDRSQLQQAKENLQKLLQEPALQHNPHRRAEAQYGLGAAYLGLGEFSRASDHLRLAQGIYDDLGCRYGSAQTLRQLGELLMKQDVIEADNQLQRALRLARNIGAKPLIADCMLSLGMVYYQRGNHEEAINYYYPQSLALFREMNARPRIAQVHFQLGQMLLRLGELADAERNYTEATQCALSVDNRSLAVDALRQLEVIALMGKHYVDAYGHFRQAEGIGCGSELEAQNEYKR